MSLCKFVFLSSFFVFIFVSVNISSASVSVDYSPSSGTDMSDGVGAPLSATDLSKISDSDDVRIQSNGSWPNAGSYDEGKYIEFVFNPNIATDATIEGVSISHEFRRSGALEEAKIEVWDGSSFVDYGVTVGVANTDHTDTVDLGSVIDTVDKVNNLKIRFMAYRAPTANTTTSHDYIKLHLSYSTPPTLDNISITTPADKLSYTTGESLDITGLVVTGSYSDSTTTIQTVGLSDVSGFDSSVALSGQVLTVTVGDKTTTYTIDIVEPVEEVNTGRKYGSTSVSSISVSVASVVPAGEVPPPETLKDIDNEVVENKDIIKKEVAIVKRKVTVVDKGETIKIPEVQESENNSNLKASAVDSVGGLNIWENIKLFFKSIFQ
ncbi:MAG: hypothetical protein WC089_02375 [Candidatus Paceibacterota bacterium]